MKLRTLVALAMTASGTPLGCGTTSPPSDAGASTSADTGPTSMHDGGGNGTDSAADAAPMCGPGAADPGKIRCGSTSCDTPVEVCCYATGIPRCTASAACNGPSIACDESTDCAPSGAYCCSGTPVQIPDAAIVVTQATFCTTTPSCLPMPGVGNSSVQACQIDSECQGTDAGCLPQVCGGTQCIRLCSTLCP